MKIFENRFPKRGTLIFVACKHQASKPHEDHEWYVMCKGATRAVLFENEDGTYRVESEGTTGERIEVNE